jgi:hypothetical protein
MDEGFTVATVPQFSVGAGPQQGGSTSAGTGTRAAHRSGVFFAGASTSMLAVLRILGLLVMAVVPGGLLVLAAWVLGKAVAERVKLEEGTAGRRLVRAVAQVRWRDVWASARHTL